MKNTYATSDLSLAAFLSMRGLNILKAAKMPCGRFEFIVNDPDNIATKLSLEYINSDFSKFDNQVRLIKKLLYAK